MSLESPRVPPPSKAPETREEEKGIEILSTFGSLLPLLNSMTFSLRVAVWLGVAMVVWIFVWFTLIKGFSWILGIIIAALALLPIVFLSRFWWALEELNDLPETIGSMVGGTTHEVSDSVKAIRSNEPKKRNLALLGSVKGLWQFGSLARDVRGLVGSYIGFGVLANPFSLLLGILSLMFIFVLMLISLIMLFLAF